MEWVEETAAAGLAVVEEEATALETEAAVKSPPQSDKHGSTGGMPLPSWAIRHPMQAWLN